MSKTKDLLTHYGIKPPFELGKILYIQSFDIKKRILSQLGLRIFQLLFCGFGLSVSLLMLYSGWQKEDIWHTLIGILFLPFFFIGIMLLIDILRTTLVVVCDKGIIRYTINYSLKIKKIELFYFCEATHYTVKEGFVDPHSPVSKKGYCIRTTWLNGTLPCFSLSHFREDEIQGFHPDKEAAKVGIEAFMLFDIRRKKTHL